MADQTDVIQLLHQACELYRDASYQSHTGHWDETMQGGAGCPECIHAKELRDQADRLVMQASTLNKTRINLESV